MSLWRRAILGVFLLAMALPGPAPAISMVDHYSAFQPSSLSLHPFSDAYGNRTVLDASGLPTASLLPLTAVGFTGRYHDAESGLMFYRARYYDPALGRFISRDPIAEWGGINLYGYCGGNPVGWVDPSGNGFIPGSGYVETELASRLRKWGAKRGAFLGPTAYFTARLLDIDAKTDAVYQTHQVVKGFRREGINGAIEETLGETLRIDRTAQRIAIYHDRNGRWLATSVIQATVGDPILEAIGIMQILEGSSGFTKTGVEICSTAMRTALVFQGAGQAILTGVVLTKSYSPSNTGASRTGRTYEVGERLPDGRTAGSGPGAAMADGPEFSMAPKSAAENLPQMKGNSVAHNEKILRQHGFDQTKVSNSAAKNQTWTQADGSEVRIHPYGNQNQAPFRSANNAHVHKQTPGGAQLTDRGFVSTDPAQTHIGIRNPKDLPQVRGRPHGAGTQ